MRNILFLSLLCVPLVGCAVAAAGAGVVAASQLGNNNVYVSRVNRDAKQTWNVTKKFLSEQSKELIEWDDQTRIAKAKIDDSLVTVQVEAWDVDQCQLTVTAKQFFATVNDGEMAKVITERLVRRLEQ